jgi:zona occludens toxin (predicted ATPase)
MSHWNPNDVNCINCATQMTSIAEQDGEWVHWCPNCGSLLTADEFDPISNSDWRVPKLSEQNIKHINSNSRRC